MICPLCSLEMKFQNSLGLSYMCKPCNLMFISATNNWLYGPKPYNDVFMYSDEIFQRMLKIKVFW